MGYTRGDSGLSILGSPLSNALAFKRDSSDTEAKNRPWEGQTAPAHTDLSGLCGSEDDYPVLGPSGRVNDDGEGFKRERTLSGSSSRGIGGTRDRIRSMGAGIGSGGGHDLSGNGDKQTTKTKSLGKIKGKGKSKVKGKEKEREREREREERLSMEMEQGRYGGVLTGVGA
jgi:hypothetical protein